MNEHDATYSPEDDKIRIYPAHRLTPEEFSELKSVGYRWAPAQKLFFAVWSPKREDVALKFCGEIGDEEKTLAERAAERAERFDGYSEHRAEEAERIKESVSDIIKKIPFGQPILIGHHSEKRARRDALRIDNGIRKAVNAWETAKYWQSRAEGALANASYTNLPAVRHRRIKGLEADLKRYRAAYTPAKGTKTFIEDGIEYAICGQGRGVYPVKVSLLPAIEKSYARAIAHVENRLIYEKAMLRESGGIISDQYDIQVGGLVLYYDEWLTVIRVNKTGGKISSVTTNTGARRNWASTQQIKIENIKDYKPPTKEEQKAAKESIKKPSICNYRIPSDQEITTGSSYRKIIGCQALTSEQWARIGTGRKSTIVVNEPTPHRLRYYNFGNYSQWTVAFITDKPEKRPEGLKPFIRETKISDLPFDIVQREEELTQ